MDIKNVVLSYYKDSTENFHIHKVENPTEARKPHTHEYYQIYYIVRGSLTHFVDDESSCLSHGDMFIIPPERVPYIVPSSDVVFYSFSFMPDLLGEFAFSNRLVANFPHSLKSNTIRPRISVVSEEIFYVESIMEHILKEFEEKPLGHSETVRAYALLLITMLARNYYEKAESAKPEPESGKEFVMHCIEYIENNFTDSFSLEEMAKRSAMPKGSFCRTFTTYTFFQNLILKHSAH